MSTDEHTREAERFAAAADEWMDADTGRKGQMSTQERILRRSCDLQAAQVHATLAQTAVAREHIQTIRAFMDAWAAEMASAESATEAQS